VLGFSYLLFKARILDDPVIADVDVYLAQVAYIICTWIRTGFSNRKNYQKQEK
jgi:hypothetical protein